MLSARSRRTPTRAYPLQAAIQPAGGECPPQPFGGSPRRAVPGRAGLGCCRDGGHGSAALRLRKQPAVLVRHVALLLSAVISYERLEACYPPIKL